MPTADSETCWVCEQPSGTCRIVRVDNEDGVTLGKHPLCENCREEMAVYDAKEPPRGDETT
jgi:hypothetical protein